MEEKVTFDDILSPTVESKPIDTADTDITCTTPSSSHPDPHHLYPDNAPLREGKSMENILLETSGMDESIDLGNSSTVCDDENDPEKKESESGEDIFVSMIAEGTEVPEKNICVSDTDEAKDPGPNIAVNRLGNFFDTVGETDTNDPSGVAPPPGQSDISKYFQSSEGVSPDIFDTLASSTTEKVIIVDEAAPAPPDVADAEDTNKIKKKVRVHLESHSSINDEITPVDFEEDKGLEPLKPTPSTRSLTKYFNADGTETSEDSQSFFDTFTVGEDEDALGLSCSSTGFPSLEQPTDSGVLVPETPPIPVGSPMPSPFHQTSAPPSATEGLPFFSEQHDKLDTASILPAAAAPLQPSFLATDQADPFSFGLNISDIDRRHDAWIPSEITRQVLITVMTSPPGTVNLQTGQMTMPGLIQNDPLGDPVRDLVHRYIGDSEAHKRVFPNADNVAQDETGLRQLIKCECWRSGVDLTGKLLTQCGQGLGKVNTPTKHTPYTLQLWLCRLSLLIRLRLYSQAEAEMKAFNNMDKPDLYYEFYQDKYPGRRGSMVPFGLRLIHAEIPNHLGKTQESLDRIYYLHAIVKKIISNLEAGLAEDGSMLTLTEGSRAASRELWESREIKLLYSVVNCLLAIKDYNTSLSIFEELLKKDVSNNSLLLCAMARIYLQMGDTSAAKKYFTQAENLMTKDDTKSKCQKHMNMGFLSLGQNQFKQAYDNFHSAVTLDNSNATALNNMAVCALYTGNLQDALDTLEKLVNDNPDLYLQEGILFNLCTLYELESSNAIFKKQKLLSMVNKHKGNGFNIACLKMV